MLPFFLCALGLASLLRVEVEMPLYADRLKQDPRYLEAQKLLFAALRDAQGEMSEVKAPDDALSASYKELVETFGKIRGFPLYYPYIGSGIGNGPFVELQDGSIKFDLISGIGVHYFGHSHPEIVLAAMD